MQLYFFIKESDTLGEEQSYSRKVQSRQIPPIDLSWP